MSTLLTKIEAARQEESFNNQLLIKLNKVASLHVHRHASIYMSHLAGGIGADKSAQELKETLVIELEMVDKLVAGHQREAALWNQMRHLCLEIDNTLKKVMEQYKQGEKAEAISRWAYGQQLMAKFYLLNQTLSDMQNAEKKLQEGRIAVFSRQLSETLNLSLFLSILIAFGLATWFSKSTTIRLKILLTNANRLAMGQAPIEKINGHDELAMLDRTYHNLYSDLVQLRRHERAVFDHVGDIICALNETLQFTEANQAAHTYFGPSLQGKFLIDLLDDNNDEISNLLMNQKLDGTTLRFETRIKLTTDLTAVLAWSACWSDEENEYFCIAQDITERSKLEKLKQDFVAVVSHDLRTPLTSIQIAHDLLEQHGLSEQEEKALSAAKVSVSRLLILVNDLLDIEKLESGFSELILMEVQLESSIREVVTSLQPLTASKQQTITLAFHRSIVCLADKAKLQQVLSNLLSNAIKFSPTGSIIEIDILYMAEQCRVEIKDCGVGIPIHARQIIFDRFRQLVPTGGGTELGTGLGLPICKAIVELHGGQIGVKDNKPTGSIFWFTLPLVSPSNL